VQGLRDVGARPRNVRHPYLTTSGDIGPRWRLGPLCGAADCPAATSAPGSRSTYRNERCNCFSEPPPPPLAAAAAEDPELQVGVWSRCGVGLVAEIVGVQAGDQGLDVVDDPVEVERLGVGLRSQPA
jgi:hypothetical protein